MKKDNDYKKLINTRRWQKLRKQKLTQHPLCQECEALGRIGVAATEVHHITPVEHGRNYAEKERLMYNPNNLRALCHTCHVAAHLALGRSGKAAARRINIAHVDSFTSNYLT